MNVKLQHLLHEIDVDFDGIYGKPALAASEQSCEIKLREQVAACEYEDYFEVISQSHSIPVMDREIDHFVEKVPESGIILDIGGCWGWHWRRLAKNRPDIAVLIVDFVRSNLPHARNILGELVGNQVALMHADATELPFLIDENFQGFDGVWTVQTFQHIPAFDIAVNEACRVLKRGGVFANYSLNVQPHIRFFKQILGKEYLTNGWIDGNFWLARASVEQKQLLEVIFSSKVSERWSEIIYSPELRFDAPGRCASWLGKLDSLLSNNVGFLRWFARQHSFHCQKP